MIKRIGNKLRPMGMPAFGGVLLAMSFPPFGLMALSLVAITPLLMAIRNCSPWQGFKKGYLFGFAFATLNMFWLQQFVDKWTQSWILGAIPWLLTSAIIAIYFGFFGMTLSKIEKLGWHWAIPLAWAGMEVFRSSIPYLFFPWALLGYSFFELPVMLQPAMWGGVYFLSAVYATFSVLAAMIWSGEVAKKTRMYSLICFAFVGGSVISYLNVPDGETIVLAAGQPGFDMAFSTENEIRNHLQTKLPQVIQMGARSVDFLVLPEGLASAIGNEPPNESWIIPTSTVLIFGAQRKEYEKRFQSAYVYDGSWHFADKSKLVIFGEYVPFRDSLPFLKAFNLPNADLSPADKITTLQFNDTKIGGLICFEALFEEIARQHTSNGAKFLTVMSNDDWYQGTGAMDLLKAGAVLRAVENRLPLAKSSPLGPSYVFDARGNTLAKTEPGKMQIAKANVVIGTGFVSPIRTFFPWIAITFFVFFLLIPKKTIQRMKPEARGL